MQKIINKSFIYIILVICNINIAVATPSSNLENNDSQIIVADRLVSKLSQIKTLQATFNQIINSNGMQTINHGVINMMQPNYFNIDIQAPERLIVGCDGSKVWQYDVALKQVVLSNYSSVETQITPYVLWNLTQTQLLATYCLQAKTNPKLKLEEFILIPKPKSKSKAKDSRDEYFTSIKLTWRDDVLIDLTWHELSGNTISLRLTDVVTNKIIPSNTFVLNVPESTDILVN